MAKILDQVVSGEEMILMRDGLPIARLTPEPAKPAKRPDRVPGSGKDVILWVSPDLDEPLEDMREHME